MMHTPTIVTALFLAACATNEEPAANELTLDAKGDTVSTVAPLSPQTPEAWFFHTCETEAGCSFDVGVSLYQPSACAFFAPSLCDQAAGLDISRLVATMEIDYTAADRTTPTGHFAVDLKAVPVSDRVPVLGGERINAANGEQGFFKIKLAQNVPVPQGVTPPSQFAIMIWTRPAPPTP